MGLSTSKRKQKIESNRIVHWVMNIPPNHRRDKTVRIRMCMRCNARRKNDFYVISAAHAKPRRLRSFFCFHLSPLIDRSFGHAFTFVLFFAFSRPNEGTSTLLVLQLFEKQFLSFEKEASILLVAFSSI